MTVPLPLPFFSPNDQVRLEAKLQRARSGLTDAKQSNTDDQSQTLSRFAPAAAAAAAAATGDLDFGRSGLFRSCQGAKQKEAFLIGGESGDEPSDQSKVNARLLTPVDKRKSEQHSRLVTKP